MKKSLLLLTVLIAGVVVCNSAEYYKIYDISGGLVRLDAGGKKSACQKNQLLSVDDVLSLSENSSITLLDERTRRLYKFEKVGDISVSEIVDGVQKKSDNIVSNVNKEIISNITGSKEKLINVFGSSIRATEGNIEALIADSIISCAKRNLRQNNKAIRVTPHIEDTGVYYSFSNNTEKSLFFNIVWQDNDGYGYSVAYDFSANGINPLFIVVPANQTVDINSVIFSNDAEHLDGYVVASDVNFNSQLLAEEIKFRVKYPNIPSSIDEDGSYIIIDRIR